MEVGKLTVEYRSETGKSAVRRLRAAGKIPAICYGGRRRRRCRSRVDPTALLKALDPVKKTNTVIDLTVAGAPDGEPDADGDGARLPEGRAPRRPHPRRLHPRRPRPRTSTRRCRSSSSARPRASSSAASAPGHPHPARSPARRTRSRSSSRSTSRRLGMGDAIHVSDLKLRRGRQAARRRRPDGLRGDRAEGGEGRSSRRPRPRVRLRPRARRRLRRQARRRLRRPAARRGGAAAGGDKGAAPAKEGGEKKCARSNAIDVAGRRARQSRAANTQHTRHNIGFMVVDELARRWKASAAGATKFGGEIAQAARTVVLLKPQEFMNLSGQAVQRTRGVLQDRAEPDDRRPRRDRPRPSARSGSRSAAATAATTGCARSSSSSGDGVRARALRRRQARAEAKNESSGHVLGGFPEEPSRKNCRS